MLKRKQSALTTTKKTNLFMSKVKEEDSETYPKILVLLRKNIEVGRRDIDNILWDMEDGILTNVDVVEVPYKSNMYPDLMQLRDEEETVLFEHDVKVGGIIKDEHGKEKPGAVFPSRSIQIPMMDEDE